MAKIRLNRSKTVRKFRDKAARARARENAWRIVQKPKRAH